MNRFVEVALIHQKALIVLALLFASAFAVGSIHIDYAFPYHTEELDHIYLAKNLKYEQNGKMAIGSNWEAGFSVWVKILDELSFGNILYVALFLPAVLAFVMSLSAFLLGRHLMKNELAGFFCGIFVLLLKSDVTLMGTWFLVPMAFAVAMIPILFYLFLKSLSVKKLWLPFLLLFAYTTLIHPAYTILLLLIFGLYFALNPKIFERNQLKIAITIIVLVLLLPFFSLILGIEKFSYSIETFKFVIFNIVQKLTWHGLYFWNPLYFFPQYFGLVLLSLGLLGFGLVFSAWLLNFSKRRNAIVRTIAPNKQVFILGLSFAVILFLYIYYHLNLKTFLAPYERMFVFLALVFLILGGIALCWLFGVTKKAIFSLHAEKKELNISLVLFSLCIVLLFFSLIAIEPFSYKNLLYRDIPKNAFSSAEWLKENSKKETNVLALPWHSVGLEAYADANIYASPVTRAGRGQRELVELFFLGNCEEKKPLIEAWKPKYVFSDTVIVCDFLNKVYSKEEYSFYEYRQ